MNAQTIFAVIPAYEPDRRLIDLVQEVKAAGMKAVVVDDGSGDVYRSVFEEAAAYANILSYPENHGKGHAMKKAFSLLQANVPKDSIIVILDCDGQHTVKDALKLCEAVRKDPAKMVLGARRQSKDSPLRSRFGNAATRTVFRLVSGVRVYDTQTGMRAFSAALLPELQKVPGERYEYEMNMLLQLAERKVPIEEVEIETIYIDNNSGSHFHAFRDSWRIYKEILKFSGSSLVSFLIDYLAYSLILLAAGTGAALFANIGARVISAAANYQLNRRFVFRAEGSAGKSALQYFALAAGILFCNTGLLWLLTAKLSMNAFAAKLIVELLLFAASYLVQKRVIFRKQPLTAG